MFQAKRNDDMVRNLKMYQEELGLQVFPELNTKVQYTEDECLAISYLLSNKPVPKELKEKIISAKKWYLPLYKLLFDVEYLGEKNYCNFIPLKSCSYLKIREDEKEKLKQLQEEFLKNWGISYAERVEIPKIIFEDMREQFAMFQGYLTLDKLEKIINKKGNRRDIISYENRRDNSDLLYKIRSKLEEANILEKYECGNYPYDQEDVYNQDYDDYDDDYNEDITTSFCDNVFCLDEKKQKNVTINKKQKKKLEEKNSLSQYISPEYILDYLPEENLKKILEMEYTKNITFAQWMQELKEQGLLQFTPYLYTTHGYDTDDALEKNILLVLEYNEQMLWNEYYNEFKLTSDGYHWGSKSVDHRINMKLQKFIKNLYEKRNYDNIGDTKLLQALFYMCIIDVGIQSRAFYDNLLNRPELLDNIVATFGIKTQCFDEFDFEFDKLSSFMKKEERTLESLIAIDDVDGFRIPVYNSYDADFCRIAVCNSLHMVLEHGSDYGSKRMRFNLEPLLEKMDWLTEEEKQSILTNKAIRNTVFLFLLAMRGVTLDIANTYIKKEFPVLPKFNSELSIVSGLNDLMLY